MPYKEAEFEKLNNTETVESTWMAEYKRALIIGVVVFLSIIVIFIVIKMILSKRKKKKEETGVN